jgi:uncharacterized protein (TIGR03083 family)
MENRQRIDTGENLMVAATIDKNSNTTTTAHTAIIQAEQIAPVTRDEAAAIAAFELQQVLHLLESLDGGDWTQPTECTLWNVRDMAGHLAGGCAGWARWRDFRRQTLLNPYIFKENAVIDAINRREVEDRAGMTPQQVIDELRKVGPKAIRNRRNLPFFLRGIPIPAHPLPGTLPLSYVADIVYPRDQWMHRMDICRATGRAWTSNPDHDRRLMDLIVLDMAKRINGRLNVVVHVTDLPGATYHFGTGEPQAEIDIDLFTLNRRSSARINAGDALALAIVRGDEDVARDFLDHCDVLY